MADGTGDQYFAPDNLRYPEFSDVQTSDYYQYTPRAGRHPRDLPNNPPTRKCLRCPQDSIPVERMVNSASSVTQPARNIIPASLHQIIFLFIIVVLVAYLLKQICDINTQIAIIKELIAHGRT